MAIAATPTSRDNRFSAVSVELGSKPLHITEQRQDRGPFHNPFVVGVVIAFKDKLAVLGFAFRRVLNVITRHGATLPLGEDVTLCKSLQYAKSLKVPSAAFFATNGI